MRTYAPSAPLAPFVRELMIVEVGEETTRLRLPEPGLVLGVRYRGAASNVTPAGLVRLPVMSLAGVSSAARSMHTEPGSGVVLARFRPGGAAQFFADPLHELFGETLSLADLVPASEAERVAARVAEGRDDRTRIAALEAFLLARAVRGRQDAVVRAALDAITASRGAVAVRTLARTLAISIDPLEKRFRRVVGATPKQIASLVRFHHTVESYSPGIRMADLAIACGFYDESHLSREVRAMTGLPPARFFRRVSPSA